MLMGQSRFDSHAALAVERLHLRFERVRSLMQVDADFADSAIKRAVGRQFCFNGLYSPVGVVREFCGMQTEKHAQPLGIACREGFLCGKFVERGARKYHQRYSSFLGACDYPVDVGLECLVAQVSMCIDIFHWCQQGVAVSRLSQWVRLAEPRAMLSKKRRDSALRPARSRASTASPIYRSISSCERRGSSSSS